MRAVRMAMTCGAATASSASFALAHFRSDANEGCVCELSHDRLVAIGAQLLQIALRRVGVMEWELAVDVVALLDRTKSFDRFVYVGHDFIVQSHV
jgi:hypothetical protein